ncbi:MAG TPA: hypothetical protein VGJ57_07915 [Nitrospirales bacterium]
MLGSIAASILLALLLWEPTLAQEAPPPAGFFTDIIEQMKFEKPTRIVGRFRSLDGYEDAIWIEWTHLHDGVRWRPVSREMMFKVLPRDAGMMEFLRTLKKGTSLHMTVQMGEDGNRRILELDEEV